MTHHHKIQFGYWLLFSCQKWSIQRLVPYACMLYQGYRKVLHEAKSASNNCRLCSVQAMSVLLSNHFKHTSKIRKALTGVSTTQSLIVTRYDIACSTLLFSLCVASCLGGRVVFRYNRYPMILFHVNVLYKSFSEKPNRLNISWFIISIKLSTIWSIFSTSCIYLYAQPYYSSHKFSSRIHGVESLSWFSAFFVRCPSFCSSILFMHFNASAGQTIKPGLHSLLMKESYQAAGLAVCWNYHNFL